MESHYRPRARQHGLLIEPIGEELLVFDTERNRAHSLNTITAAVWQACDGGRDHEELEACCGIDEPTLGLALERLRAAHLVEGAEASAGVSRRLMIRKSVGAGAALGVAIPVIRSITAPTPALAQSGTVTCGSSCASANACSHASSGCIHCTSHSLCYTSCMSAAQSCGGSHGSPCCIGLQCKPNSRGGFSCQA